VVIGCIENLSRKSITPSAWENAKMVFILKGVMEITTPGRSISPIRLNLVID